MQCTRAWWLHPTGCLRCSNECSSKSGGERCWGGGGGEETAEKSCGVRAALREELPYYFSTPNQKESLEHPPVPDRSRVAQQVGTSIHKRSSMCLQFRQKRVGLVAISARGSSAPPEFAEKERGRYLSCLSAHSGQGMRQCGAIWVLFHNRLRSWNQGLCRRGGPWRTVEIGETCPRA
jgi:hypothetical protein